jgi:CheY-like chemotaxis protein
VGSIFTVALDFSIAAKPIENEMHAENNEEITLLKDKQILVVDDDETLLLLISAMLSSLSIKVDTAANGKEALVKLGKTKYDLVFTDVNMPEMNGFELMKKIKLIDLHVPVVAITANSTLDRNYQQDGFANYLAKPFKENEIIQKLVDVLSFNSITPTIIHTLDQEKIPVQVPREKPYSVEGIIGFVGNEPEAIRRIIASFVNNSLITVNEINILLPTGDFEAISQKAHKLIPGFKQLRLDTIVSNLEKLERYRELNIPGNKLFDITQETITTSEKLIHIIEKDWL